MDIFNIKSRTPWGTQKPKYKKRRAACAKYDIILCVSQHVFG